MTAHELHQDAFDIPGLREVPADDGDRPPDAQPMAQRPPRRKAEYAESAWPIPRTNNDSISLARCA
ncbi:hypothetical protein [Bifidobacterium parmae]|uniref:hypothetical protein n=1 Tax=Bifidobacterium parmae TaxID=361854 RepID=UPI00105556B2|nr:hypothetical protein [Bifidobacterium parmae]